MKAAYSNRCAVYTGEALSVASQGSPSTARPERSRQGLYIKLCPRVGYGVGVARRCLQVRGLWPMSNPRYQNASGSMLSICFMGCGMFRATVGACRLTRWLVYQQMVVQ